MRRFRSRRSLVVVVTLAVLAMVLAACSSPEGPEADLGDIVTVELDGFEAQIEMSKVDQEGVSALRLQRTTYCDTNVSYNRVVVPMLAYDGKSLTTYVDIFWMPRTWNRKLVLYAHGYISPGSATSAGFLDLIASDPAQLESIDRFLCAGNAIGVSSYSAQGYAVQQGIAETHLMNAVFPLIFWRTPRETYVMGSSMGGLITVALAENFPRRYDGAMPTCGPVGGSLAEFNYLGNVRLLFDTAFPGVLGGSLTAWQPPAPNWVDQVLVAIGNDPVAFAKLANTYMKFNVPPFGPVALPAVESRYGPAPEDTDPFLAPNALLHALRYVVEGGGDAFMRGGGSPFSNVGFTYGPLLPGDEPGFVQPTEVLTSDSQAVSYYTRYYQPTGDQRVPTLSLHGWFDPDVPAFHEGIYRAIATSTLGTSLAGAVLRQYLVAGYVPDDIVRMMGADPSDFPIAMRDDILYGHCNFRPVDLVEAFGALVQRVNSGTWPDLDLANPRFSALP